MNQLAYRRKIKALQILRDELQAMLKQALEDNEKLRQKLKGKKK